MVRFPTSVGLILVCLIAFRYGAFGQGALQGPPANHILFRFFFLHVLSTESFGDTLRAKGKSDTAARRTSDAGLKDRISRALRESSR